MTRPRGAPPPLVLALTLALAGCPAAKPPTTGPGAKPRPKATTAVQASVPPKPAGIADGALAKAVQGLAKRAVPATQALPLRGVVRIISDNGGGIISDNGGGIISNNSGAIIANNGGSIISDNGGGIISDNGGGIISDNGGGLVSNNGGGLTSKTKYGLTSKPTYGLAQAQAAEFALADAVVTFQDAAGNLLTTPDGTPIVAYTDRTGKFEATLPLPAENVVMRVRLWNGGEVLAMAPRDGVARPLPIDTATSLGAAYVLGEYVKGDQRTYDKLPASEADLLRRAIADANGRPDRVPTYEAAALAKAAAALRTKAPAVDKKLEDIKALLIGQVGDGDGRPASEVALPRLEGMVVDAQGRLFLGEAELGKIRDVRPDGLIGTYADINRGKPVRQSFTELEDLAVGPGGVLYVSAGNAVYRLAPDGTVTKVAGSGFKDRGALGGKATEANLQPSCLAPMPDGSLYVVDGSEGGPEPRTRVVKVTPDGLALDVTAEVCPDLPDYLDLAVTPDGALLSLTYGLTVRRWKAGEGSAVVATLESGNQHLDARLALAPDGTIYVSQPDQHRVTALAPDGTRRIAAGAGGPAATAGLVTPSRLATAPDGTLYVNDRQTALVSALGPDGGWRVVAGTTGSVRADGDLTAIAINRPYGAAYDAEGGLVFSENGGYTVRRFAKGAITTIAGATLGDGGDGGPAAAAGFNHPGLVAIHAGTTWVMDEGNGRLRAIGPDGTIRTVVGRSVPLGNTAEALGLRVKLAAGERRRPEEVHLLNARGLAVDAGGRPYWTMTTAGQIWRLAADGMVESVAGAGTDGNVNIGLDALISLGFGGESEPAAEAKLVTPFGLAFGPEGDLYVAELFGFRVRRLSGLAGGTPTLHRFVGKTLPEMMAFEGTVGSVEGWAARDIAVPAPLGVAFDGQGRAHIGYAGTNNLLAFYAAAGQEIALPPGVQMFPPGVIRIEPGDKIHHVAGPFSSYYADPTTDDAMVAPAGLAVDGEGRLAIADFAASVLRILPPGTSTPTRPQ